MTLFEKLKSIIGLGWTVSFSSFAFQFQITVEKEFNNISVSEQSWLPLSDHFYESKIIDCIEYMIDKIELSQNK